jgi:hypothetical protein
MAIAPGRISNVHAGFQDKLWERVASVLVVRHLLTKCRMPGTDKLAAPLPLEHEIIRRALRMNWMAACTPDSGI